MQIDKITVDFGPEEEVGEEAGDEVMVDGVHVGGGGLADEGGHV